MNSQKPAVTGLRLCRYKKASVEENLSNINRSILLKPILGMRIYEYGLGR